VCGGVEDYPRTLTELEARFATDEACGAYLSQLRWPDGFVCHRYPWWVVEQRGYPINELRKKEQIHVSFS
jgi:Transposase zinc-ribbon domain